MTDTANQTATGKNKPSVLIHAKVPNGRGTKIGAQIGAGWFFENNGDVGINIILDASPIPLDGQIQIVGFPPSDK